MAKALNIHILFINHWAATVILNKTECCYQKRCGAMVDPKKRRYLNISLAVFSAIAMSLILFFILFRMQGIGNALKTVSDILAPFVYGGVIAYLLRPLCNTYESFFTDILPQKAKRFANGVAVILSIITGILVVYTLIIMIAPQLYSSILSLWNSLPEKINQFIVWATEVFGEDDELLQLFNSISQKLMAELESWTQNTLIPQITNIVSGVGSSVLKVLNFLYNLLIGLIVAVYLLGSRKKFARQSVLLVRSCLKPKWADMFLNEIAFIDRMFGGFIDGKILDSAIIGVLCYIGCVIFKFPNPLLIAAIVGITNVIPFFGPFIGAVPSTFLILIEDPIKALWFVLFVLVLQQLDGNIIGPAILGDRTGISSFWVLFTIILCGGLWGIVGMIIAVPLFAVIYDIIKKLVRRGLCNKDQMELWQQYKADYPDEKPKRK